MGAISPEDLAKAQQLGTFPDGSTNFGLGTVYIVVASIITPILIAFVALRLYVRLRLQKSPGWDDAACVVATLCQLAYTGMNLYLSAVGLGKNVWEVQPVYVMKIINLIMVVTALAMPCLFFTKLSLFLLYWRLFSPKVYNRWAIYIGVAVCALYYLISLVLFITFYKNDRRLDVLNMNASVAIMNPITDFYLLGLPMVAVWNLQMPFRRKLGAILLFAWGLLACVMSILSAIYRFQYNRDVFTNPTRGLIPVFTVNTVEVGIGIVCGCVPVLPVLFTTGKIKACLRYFRSERSTKPSIEEHRKLKTTIVTTKRFPSSASELGSDDTSTTHVEEEV